MFRSIIEIIAPADPKADLHFSPLPGRKPSMHRTGNHRDGLVRKSHRPAQRVHHIRQRQPRRRRNPRFRQRVRLGEHARRQEPSHPAFEEEQLAHGRQRFPAQISRVLFQRVALLRREGGHDPAGEAEGLGPGRKLQFEGGDPEESDGGR